MAVDRHEGGWRPRERQPIKLVAVFPPGGSVDQVARILADTGMDPLRLQLEVTESLAAQDTDVQQRLHELKALGITPASESLSAFTITMKRMSSSIVMGGGAARHGDAGRQACADAGTRQVEDDGADGVAAVVDQHQGIGDDGQAGLQQLLAFARGADAKRTHVDPAKALSELQPLVRQSLPGTITLSARTRTEPAESRNVVGRLRGEDPEQPADGRVERERHELLERLHPRARSRQQLDRLGENREQQIRRGKADGDSPYNDSAFVQFSDSVTSSSTRTCGACSRR